MNFRNCAAMGLATAALALAGCAKYPENRGPAQGTQLVVTMRVRGQVHPLDAATPYYYFALINLTDDVNAAGPAPVVGLPWGNGFAAPAQRGQQGFVGLVRYDRFQGPGGYGVFRVADRPTNDDYTPTVFTPLLRPDEYRTPQNGESQLYFRLDLKRLQLDPNVPLPRYVQINLLATNNLPQGDDEGAAKAWDALGDGRDTGSINTWITIPLDRSSTRTNAQSVSPEPAGDVREKLGATVEAPDLDIVDWTVEVRAPGQ